ncbi:MAG: hypothetical protein OXH57_03490 [Ekhidna sp.]|nr:hypothetical protein [Ekhidna sp.]
MKRKLTGIVTLFALSGISMGVFIHSYLNTVNEESFTESQITTFLTGVSILLTGIFSLIGYMKENNS